MIVNLKDLTKPITLVELLRWRAFHHPDQCAYTFLGDGGEEVSLTYKELDRQARSIGARLQRLGVMGERVLILCPPGLKYIAAFFGCLYAGGIAVPSYLPRLNRPDPRLWAIVRDAQAAISLTTTQVLSNLEARFTHTPDLRALQWLVTDDLIHELGEEWENPSVPSESLALLQYTSGSTASPKGVMVSHSNLLHNLALIHQYFGHTAESRGVIWLPPYHDMGLIGGILQPLYGGFPVLLMSPIAFLQRPIRWLQAISRYQGTTSGGPNFAYDLCVRKTTPEERATLDLSSWEVAFNGAEPIRPHTLEQFATTFEPYGFHRKAFYPCYGLAEATLIVSGGVKAANPVIHSVSHKGLESNQTQDIGAENDDNQLLVGCGQALLGHEIVIVDPEFGCKCSSGCVGEIWISGPSVAQGYWHRTEETATTFQAYLTDTGEGPFLRTGDLGFLMNGELFVTGRLKDLIIIRGRNHYPHDIELTIEESHQALRSGCSAAFSVEMDGEERLVLVQEVKRGHQTVDMEEVVWRIRQAVAKEHELQVYAVVLIKPGTIPKTSSGKIQRYACRIKFLQGDLDIIASNILSSSPDLKSDEDLTGEKLIAMEPSEGQFNLEIYLKKQIAQMLRVSPTQLDPQQPLITLGIDSLMSVELQNRFESDLGVSVSTVDFLKGINITQLTRQILEHLGAMEKVGQRPPLEIVPRHKNLPISFEQERLWFLNQLRPGNPTYNIPVAVHIQGQLDVHLLEKSLNQIVARHEILRTIFVTANGSLVQIIVPVLTLTLPVIDLSKLSQTAREADTHRLIAEEAQYPFNLAQGPLLRATLLRLDAEHHIITFTIHHIIADIASVAVLFQELATFYQASSADISPILPDLAFQYVDFANWQRQWMAGELLEARLLYWKTQLSNAPSASLLPTDRPRPPIQSFRGAYQFFDLSPKLVASIRDLSRQSGVTFFVTLLTAFKALLYHYVGEEDILVGTPTRGRVYPESETLIGLFAHPLVVRTNISGDPTFRELLACVHKVALDAYTHQEVPFAKVVEVTRPERSGNYTPLFQTMFSLIKSPLENIHLQGVTLELIDIDSGLIDFDLFLNLVEEEKGLHGALGYNTDLFNVDTVESLIDFYHQILEKCVQLPEIRLSQLNPSKKIREKVRIARMRDQGLTIAIAATFTAEPVEDALNFWIQKLDIPSKIKFASYNQVFQELLDPSSLLNRNNCGINVILIRFDDWQRYEANDEMRVTALSNGYEKIERNTYDLIAALKSAVERSTIPYLVCLCPASPEVLTNSEQAVFFQQLEEIFVSKLETVSNVYIVTTSELTRLYPVSKYYDAFTDNTGHIPFTPAFFTALGTMIARKIWTIFSKPPYKVIVLDCDQTLWKGVCGEDGAFGVEVDPPRRALQEFMVAQYHAGMLLCLCSKNNEQDVVDVFECRPEMPLTRKHIISWRINWKPKSENIRSLADELQLGLDSFICLDDNPIECAEIQASCPEVLTLWLPQETENLSRFLNHIWAFDHVKVTEEDQKRTVLYQQNRERERFQRESLTLEDFLADLELNIQISPLAPHHVTRAAQLTQRTNQFNFTTIRRTGNDIQRLCLTEEIECLGVEVRDRFGDYGIVGLIIFEAGAASIRVDTFLLSCRALGRGVEHRMLARLGEIAKIRGVGYVEVRYIPTPKNHPGRDFLEHIGAQFKQTWGQAFLYKLPVESLTTLSYTPVVTESPRYKEKRSSTLNLLIPDYDSLINTVLENSRNKESVLHGIHHWQCVAWTGYHLSKEVEGCDAAVVLLFAIFHDCMRINDGVDPDHGKRAGMFARTLQERLYRISPSQMDILQEACAAHTYGLVTSDPTLGVCWDADRLNLWRVGIKPKRKLLSTEAAQKDERIEWARSLNSQSFDWQIIYTEFNKLF